MSEFKPEPSLTLETVDDLREALDGQPWRDKPHPFKWCVKSVWLIKLIDEYVATGKYPYNADVQRLAEQRLGIAQQPDNGSALSLLVYNAQNYRRSDALRTAGYAPLSQDMIEDAFRHKAAIEIVTDSFLGCGKLRLTVREVAGKHYAFQPRKRKYAVTVQGQPAKIIA